MRPDVQTKFMEGNGIANTKHIVWVPLRTADSSSIFSDDDGKDQNAQICLDIQVSQTGGVFSKHTPKAPAKAACSRATLVRASA